MVSGRRITSSRLKIDAKFFGKAEKLSGRYSIEL